MKTALQCVGVAIASVILTAVVLFAIGLARDAKRAPAHPRVAFSDLLAEIDHGRVDDVRIEGRVYTYRIKGAPEPSAHEAIGPTGDESVVRALRPSDPSLPAPKVTLGSR